MTVAVGLEMNISVVTKLLVIIPAALLISSDKILAAPSPTPFSSPLTKENAAATARELLAAGNARRAAYKEAAKKIRDAGFLLKALQNEVAQNETFFSKLHPDDIDSLPGIVAEVKKHGAAVQAALTPIRNGGTEAIMIEASCREAQERACDYAKRSASATEAEIKNWRSEVTTLISQSQNKIQDAQAKAKVFQEASENLQVAIHALESYAAALSNFSGERGVERAWQDSETLWKNTHDAIQVAAKAAEAGNAAAGDVRQICQKVRRLLYPPSGLSSDTALLNQADELERDMTDLTMSDSEEVVENARKRLDEITAAVKRLMALIKESNADAVLREGRDVMAQAAQMEASVSMLANYPPAVAELERASKCLAEIQSRPLAGDEVLVPDLSVFDSVSEMKATLAHAGLVAALVAAKEKPPSKETEFKFAGQDPVPNAKVKRGSTVSIAIYQKFEPGEAAAAEGDGIVGRWNGTITWPGGASDVVGIQIQKRGNGYEVIDRNGKANPATYANGVLHWTDKGSISGGGRTTSFPVKTTLRLQGDTLTGTLEAGGKPATLSLRRN